MGGTHKCIVVASPQSKHCKKTGTDFVEKKGALPSPSRRKWRYYLKPLNMQENSMQDKLQGASEDDNRSAERSAKN